MASPDINSRCKIIDYVDISFRLLCFSSFLFFRLSSYWISTFLLSSNFVFFFRVYSFSFAPSFRYYRLLSYFSHMKIHSRLCFTPPFVFFLSFFHLIFLLNNFLSVSSFQICFFLLYFLFNFVRNFGFIHFFFFVFALNLSTFYLKLLAISFVIY